MFKKTMVAGAVAAALGSGLAQAAEPAGPHTFTGNVGFYSQYIFRGLTQTNREPAIQGGFDYSHASGFYLGTWGSNISWLKDGAPPQYTGGGSLEWDFYGGWKWGFAPDWTLDLGGLYYWYPGDANSALGLVKADTFELYAGLSWKWLSAKFSYAVSDKVFGVTDADGTYYVDFGLNMPLGDFSKEMTGWTIFAHYGIQKFTGGVANDNLFSYDDWKIGISYTLPKDFTIGVFYSDTSSLNNFGYGSVAEGGVYPRNLGKGTGTVYIQKTF